MESLGGNCGVAGRSDGKSGSCFWFSIPFRPDETVVEDLCMHSRVDSHHSTSHCQSQLTLSSSGGASWLMQEKNSFSGDDSSHSKVTTRGHQLRILLVDDSIMIRKTTSKSLCKEGYQVEVAQNGAECLKILESSKLAAGTSGFMFDVILMDLQMPVMDGLEATRRIRAFEHMMNESNDGSLCSHIIIIGISANTAGEARADCMESGMDGFIEKPLRIKYFQNLYSKLKFESVNNI
jgi:CheY-like chemotaxis protein